MASPKVERITSALSKPFGLSSKISERQAEQEFAFQYYPAHLMSPESLFNSLQVLKQGKPQANQLLAQQQAKTQWCQDFYQPYVNEIDNEVEMHLDFHQTVAMLNSELVDDVLEGPELQRIAESPWEPQRKVEAIWLMTLARKPSAAEFQFLQPTENNLESWQDRLWVVLTSTNFSLQH